MMRSLSRTEETSGLVTMIASSAKYRAMMSAVLDAGRAVADDVVELVAQLFQDALDALIG